MTQIIGLGSTIGILGAGQLGRMLAISARQMGGRVWRRSQQSVRTGQRHDLARRLRQRSAVA